MLKTGQKASHGSLLEKYRGYKQFKSFGNSECSWKCPGLREDKQISQEESEIQVNKTVLEMEYSSES